MATEPDPYPLSCATSERVPAVITTGVEPNTGANPSFAIVAAGDKPADGDFVEGVWLGAWDGTSISAATALAGKAGSAHALTEVGEYDLRAKFATLGGTVENPEERVGRIHVY